MSERGDIVVVATKGDYTGKPRPWVVVQSNSFASLDSVTLCMLTTVLLQGAPMLRVDVAPSQHNGLRVASQVQIDKTVTVPASKITSKIGEMELPLMRQLDDALRLFLDL